MPEPLIAGMPPNLVLAAGTIVRLRALDPTTGAVVAGVTVSDAMLTVTDLGGNADDGVPSPLLVPSNLA